MSTKVKLISAIMALIIVTSIMIVGVMALSDVTFNMSGTVNFVVVETDVFLNKVTLKNTVTQTPNGYQANDVVLEDYSNMYLHQGTSIDLSEVTVLSGQTMEIDFDMTSLNENYLKVMLNYSNLPSGVSVNSTSLFMPKNPSGELAQGETKTYKIYISNTGTTSLSLSDINLQVSFDDTITSLLQVDTTNEYYYVEMGTMATSTGSQYLKWRDI